MNNPKYIIDEVVYIKESSAIGFIEAARIAGISYGNDGWLYTLRSNIASPRAPATYGDKNLFARYGELIYSEDELITYCEALTLAEGHAQRILTNIQTQLSSFCNPASDPTQGI